MIDAKQLVGTHHVLFMTLDTLRFDVAAQAMDAGRTPTLAKLIPNGRWERRHTSGSFTWAAHQAFFAGFLPTPAAPGPHPRLFAATFAGSETTVDSTFVFDSPDLVHGLAEAGYHTVCVGGVGFFNKQTPLGSVFPNLFAESHWSPDLGVTAPDSTERQVEVAIEAMDRLPSAQRMMLFVNVSALHQPNCHYIPGATADTPATQAAALEYVDGCLGKLFDAMRVKGPWLCIICSDHGTAYGEDGHVGHRYGHEVIWTVPYAEFIMPPIDNRDCDIASGEEE